MNLPVWLQAGAGGVTLSLHIQPGAKKTEIVGAHGDALKVRLAAPPVDGKANEALLAYLAKCLGLGRRQIELVSGMSSRAKRIRIEGADAQSVLSKLL